MADNLPLRSRQQHQRKHLQPDIIVEILSRLPTKSLLRFKSASKSWDFLISESSFVKKHLSRINNNTDINVLRLLFSVDPPRSIDYEALSDVRELNLPRLCPMKTTIYEPKVVGTCNGLICLQGEDERYVLVNPCTREVKKLPEFPSHFRPDPSGLLLYGFGYDSTKEDYKVVLGAGPRGYGFADQPRSGRGTTTIAVFSLKKGFWRIVETLNYVNDFEQGCLFNGVLHWPDVEYEFVNATQIINGQKSRIIAFDLAKEEFRVVALPSDVANKQLFSPGLGTGGNCLFVYFKSKGDYELCNLYALTVWMMKEYGVKESWTKLLEISDNCLPRFRSYGFGMGSNFRWSPVSILENGEVLMISDDEFALFDPSTWRDRSVLEVSPRLLCCEPVIYAETLISPVTGSGTEE